MHRTRDLVAKRHLPASRAPETQAHRRLLTFYVACAGLVKTTLKDLGLLKGRALIRVDHRASRVSMEHVAEVTAGVAAATLPTAAAPAPQPQTAPAPAPAPTPHTAEPQQPPPSDAGATATAAATTPAAAATAAAKPSGGIDWSNTGPSSAAAPAKKVEIDWSGTTGGAGPAAVSAAKHQHINQMGAVSNDLVRFATLAYGPQGTRVWRSKTIPT